MDQELAKAAAAAAAEEDEGRELDAGTKIWATNSQHTTLSSHNPPSFTKPRSDSAESYATVSSALSDFETVEHFDIPKPAKSGNPTTYNRNILADEDPLLSGDEDEEDAKLTSKGKKPVLPGSMDGGSSSNSGYGDSEWPQAGQNADPQDLAGPGAQGYLLCTVSKPQKEAEGTQNPYITFLVTADTDFKSFTTSHTSVRRRFTDFVFLYKTLAKEYPQCAVPPLPDKHNMSYVRGDRFGSDFTSRRAHSLDRFLKRLTLHPVLRRAVVLNLFLESSDWNATMKGRPQRGNSGTDGGGVLESWTDTFLNAFSKPHKTDKRFADVNTRASKLNSDLSTVEQTVARVAKREADLETDYADLSVQFQKLAALEPGVAEELQKFATSVQSTSEAWRDLKDHTDQNYLGSLKDMEAYINSIKALLKTRENKQLDFEGLTDMLNSKAYERDMIASNATPSTSSFLRQKIEDVRGVDPQQAKREKQRKLEVDIDHLQNETERAKKTTEAFDEEVVKEVQDFERIKAVEFRDTLGGLADAHIDFFKSNIEIWEKFVADMEKMEAEGAGEAGR